VETLNQTTFRDAQQAFNEAIAAGRLKARRDDVSGPYAGNYMYMGTWSGKDHFKNRYTREYIA
jgi:hypothetical protein